MNPYVKSNVTEIDLLDLMKYLLQRIVWILLAGVVCAGIVGVYKYYSIKSSAPDSQAIAQEETEYKLDLEKYEQESELIVSSDANTVELIRKQKDYLQSSPFMQLDPYNVWASEAVVQVASSSPDYPASQLAEMFKSGLMNEDYLKDLARARGTETAYLKELIRAESVEKRNGAGSGVILLEEESDKRDSSTVFYVRIYGSSKEEAAGLMDAVLEELQDLQKDSEKEYPNEVKVLSNSCAQTVDTDLRNRQKDNMTYTQTLLYQMSDNTTRAAALTKPQASAAPAAGGISKRSLLKFGLIGFVAGVFLMCLWYALRYIMNKKLVSYPDIERKGLYLKDLGSISDQGIAMAAANIRNFAGEKRRLLLTGMTAQAEFEKVCSSLKEYLSEFEIVFMRDVLHDPKSRELLLDCDAAVLVEQKGVTRYPEMKDEAIFLFNAGKEIVGVVIV